MLFVIPYFTPEMGGDVNVCEHLSRQLVKLGHSVTILTTDHRLNRDYSDSIDGVDVLHFRSVLSKGIFFYTPSLRRWLKENLRKFDVLHLHGYRSYQNWLCARYARKYSIPYILQPHGQILRVISRIFEKWLFDVAVGRKIIENACRLIVLSKTEYDNVLSMGGAADRAIIVPNGFTRKAGDAGHDEAFYSKHRIDPGGQNILYTGRLHEEKGVDLLIKAFSMLGAQGCDATLILVGPDHGQQGRLENMSKELGISDKVRFMGFLSEEEKIKTLKIGTILAYPRYHGMPISFLEAMSYGLPLVTTNGGDNLDWIDGQCGLVTDYDPKELSEAIGRLLGDPNLREQFGQSGQRMVRDRFNWELAAKRIEAEYVCCIEGGQ